LLTRAVRVSILAAISLPFSPLAAKRMTLARYTIRRLVLVLPIQCSSVSFSSVESRIWVQVDSCDLLYNYYAIICKQLLAKLRLRAADARLNRIVFPLAQPNLDSPVFFAAVLRIVGSDWQGLAKSIYKRRFYASHLQLVGDYSGTVLGKCDILSGPAGVVGETEQE